MGINDGNSWEIAHKINRDLSEREPDIWDYCPMCGDRVDGIVITCPHKDRLNKERRSAMNERFHAAVAELELKYKENKQ